MKLFFLIPLLAFIGCSNTPVKNWERDYFNVIQTNVPRVVTVTNIVYETVTQTNVVIETKTNEIGQLVSVFLTNYVPVEVVTTNSVKQTNWVTIEQFIPGNGSQATVAIGQAVAAPFGWGQVVGYGLMGILSIYLGFRNRQLAGQSTVATQTSGVLTQNIETLLNVLQQTPQGQQLMPMLKNYLMSHQNEMGVIENVAAIIREFVDKPAAKDSADAILKAIQTIKS